MFFKTSGLKRISVISLLLVLSMFAGLVPVAGAQTLPGVPRDNYTLDVFVSTGDSLWLTESPPVDSPAAIDALFDLYKQMDIRRIYWRGIQQTLWNKVMVIREENVKYARFMSEVKEVYADFEARTGMEPDQYAVQAAHQRGMEIWGVSSLMDWGSSADTASYVDYPFAMEADFRLQHQEWAPIDKYGVIRQGGPIDFSYPEARATLAGLHADEVRNAGYDGLVFLTYTENFSQKYEDQYGYNEPIVEEFHNRFGIKPNTDDFNRFGSREDWHRLRGEYVTQFLQELKSSLSTIRDGVKLGLYINPQRPYTLQPWNEPKVLINNIYLDLETWVQEGIVDQFLVAGYSSPSIQAQTIKNLKWMTRGTDIEVSLYTSVPTSPYWKEFQDQGIPTVLQIGGGGEETYFMRAGVAVDNETTRAMDFLAHVVHGETAAVEDVAPYLNDPNLIIRRMAIRALIKLGLPSAVPLIEDMLKDQENSVRSAAALALRALNGSNSAQKILDAVNVHDDWTLMEAGAVTLGVMRPFPEQQLMASASSSNPTVRMVAMRALSYLPSADMVPLLQQAISDPDRATRFYALESLGKVSNNTDAVDILIAATGSEDVMVSNKAATSLGVMAAREDSAFTAKRSEILNALNVLYGSMGQNNGRADAEWGYRSVGDALLAMGEEGEAVLRQYMNQTNDATLAESAWKNLYVRYTPRKYVEVTEKEYDEAFSMMPQILKNYNLTKLSQDFDNVSVFPTTLTGNVWAGNNATTAGRWGVFSSSGVIVDDTVYHSAPHSAKLVRGGNNLVSVINTGIVDGESHKLSFRTYRSPDSSYVAMTTTSNYKIEAALVVKSDGSVFLQEANGTGYTVNSGLTVPANKWTMVELITDRSSGTLTVAVTPEGEAVQKAEAVTPFTELSDIKLVLFSPQGTTGSISYIDDVLWVQASAHRSQPPTVALADTSVGYDGSSKQLTATTLPEGLDVLIEYEGINGIVYPKSMQAPTEAGVYRVTATVVSPGYDDMATAKLTIRKAIPVLSSGGVTASGLEYGELLGNSVLTGEYKDMHGNPLEGSFTWDEGNLFYPPVTGLHAYTFTPTSLNYVKARGQVEVEVDSGWTGLLTKLSQNFDDTSMFNTDTYQWVGDSTTSHGRWGAFGTNGPVVDSQFSYSGSQSAKLIRGAGSAPLRSIMPVVSSSGDYEVSFHIRRESGKSLVVRTDDTTSGAIEGAFYISGTGTVALFNHETNSYNISTGLVIAPQVWTQVKMRSDRSNGTIHLSVTPKGGEEVQSSLSAPLPMQPVAVNSIAFFPQMPEGIVAYIDNVMLLESTTVPQLVKVTMQSKTTVFNGLEQSLEAVSLPADLAVSIFYTGSNSTVYEKSTTPPRNAGTYSATALVTEPGYAGIAAASLTIEQANPVPDQVGVTVSELVYGQTLGESGLHGVYLDVNAQPLAGQLFWTEGDDIVPEETGVHAYSFIPNDPNYATVQGELTVVVNHPAVFSIIATTTAGGSITPSGEVLVKEGDDQMFEFIADNGYKLSSLTVDDQPVTVTGSTYLFTDVSAHHSIHISFEEEVSPAITVYVGTVDGVENRLIGLLDGQEVVLGEVKMESVDQGIVMVKVDQVKLRELIVGLSSGETMRVVLPAWEKRRVVIPASTHAALSRAGIHLEIQSGDESLHFPPSR